MGSNNIKTVVFDLGRVLIDYEPRYLFRKMFGNNTEDMEYFLSNICNFEWNAEQDAGRTFQEGVDLLLAEYPQYEPYIVAYKDRWEETIGDEISESVSILKQIKQSNMPLYALTNWSAETFPFARRRFDFLTWFDDILVSGEVKLRKPDLKIYQLLFEKFNINPSTTLFIDDTYENIVAAQQSGMQTIHFENPQQMRRELTEYCLIS